MSELKKCPGCNGEAKFNEQFNGCIPRISKSVFYSCECGWCGPAVTGKCETKEDLFKLAERAAEKWNRRSQPENEPIVRCGECIVPIIDCPAGDAVMLKTDFCSYGKRKPERSEG